MMTRRSFFTVTAALLAILLLLTFSSCGKNDKSFSSEIRYSTNDGGSPEEVRKESSLSAGDVISENRKMIITGEIFGETKDFAGAVKEIRAETEKAGGYVESSRMDGSSYGYESLRSASLVLRIPSDKTESFTVFLSGRLNVISSGLSSEDITKSYYEAKSSMDSLKVQEERLLAMLEKAETLDYLIQLEDKLAEVRQKITYYESIVNAYDNKVDYATLTVTVREVKDYTEDPGDSFGSRLSSAFRDSWKDFGEGCKDFAVFFVGALPTLLILGLIAFAVVTLIRKNTGKTVFRRKPDKNKKEKDESEKPQ